MGRSRHRQLDRLIEEVSRGQRELSSIRNAGQRDAVRIALRLHAQSAAWPDPNTRTRMRARVLARLDIRPARLRDHAWAMLELMARPAPYIARGTAIASILVCLGMSAIVASADTLPDDLLYPAKLGTEAVRLALADTPSDRAVIETSIAEHRLHEAERLATSGRTTDALVASAMYSQHIATAAAELAARPASDLARQLESRFDADRARARTLATSLSVSATSAGAAHVLEMIAKPTAAPGETGVVRVASTAAGVVEELVQVAEETASDAADAMDDEHSVEGTGGDTSAATPAVTRTETSSSAPGDGPHASEASRPRTDATATRATRADARKANEALRMVRRAAAEARAAADRAKAQAKGDGS